MFKTVWAKGLGLVAATAVGMLIGGVALAGLGGHNALARSGAAGQTTAVTATSAFDAVPVSGTALLADSTVPATLTDRIIDMMKDHMGFTDQQAGDWTDVMADHMQAVHADLTGPTLDQMYQFMDQNGFGGTMMNGTGAGTAVNPGSMMNGAAPGTMMGGTYSQSPGDVAPGVMMGRTTTTTGGTTTPSTNTPTTQSPGTMMNGVDPSTMMGNTTTTAAGGGTTTTTGATTQTGTAPQTYVTPGAMMGGTQVTPGAPAGASGTMMNGATAGGMMGGAAGGGTRTR